VRPLQTQGGETAGRASPKEVLMPLKDSVPEVRTLMTGLMFDL
jgi:Ku70/Ku80 beta-barrel domain